MQYKTFEFKSVFCALRDYYLLYSDIKAKVFLITYAIKLGYFCAWKVILLLKMIGNNVLECESKTDARYKPCCDYRCLFLEDK